MAPSSYIPTSKETRVRVDDFQRSSPRLFPRQQGVGDPFFPSSFSCSASIQDPAELPFGQVPDGQEIPVIAAPPCGSPASQKGSGPRCPFGGDPALHPCSSRSADGSAVARSGPLPHDGQGREERVVSLPSFSSTLP